MMLLFGVLACSESPSQQQPQTVSTKIAIEPPRAEAAVTPSEEQVSIPVQQDEPVQVPPEAQTAVFEATGSDPEATLGEKIAAAEPSDLIKESLQIAGSYDPKGRFNPFDPLFKAQPEVQPVAATGERRARRVPQTPLERVALSQLKVTAIIRAPSGNRAMVEDATGKGFVVTKGTYIGLNSGRVIDIDNNRIQIEKEIENIMGELKIQIAELKLQKPAGEL